MSENLLHLMSAKLFPSFMVLSHAIIMAGRENHICAPHGLPSLSKDSVYDAVDDRRSEPKRSNQYRGDEQAIEERVEDGPSNQSGYCHPNHKYRYYPAHQKTLLNHCDKLSQWL